MVDALAGQQAVVGLGCVIRLTLAPPELIVIDDEEQGAGVVHQATRRLAGGVIEEAHCHSAGIAAIGDIDIGLRGRELGGEEHLVTYGGHFSQAVGGGAQRAAVDAFDLGIAHAQGLVDVLPDREVQHAGLIGERGLGRIRYQHGAAARHHVGAGGGRGSTVQFQQGLAAGRLRGHQEAAHAAHVGVVDHLARRGRTAVVDLAQGHGLIGGIQSPRFHIAGGTGVEIQRAIQHGQFGPGGIGNDEAEILDRGDGSGGVRHQQAGVAVARIPNEIELAAQRGQLRGRDGIARPGIRGGRKVIANETASGTVVGDEIDHRRVADGRQFTGLGAGRARAHVDQAEELAGAHLLRVDRAGSGIGISIGVVAVRARIVRRQRRAQAVGQIGIIVDGVNNVLRRGHALVDLDGEDLVGRILADVDIRPDTAATIGNGITRHVTALRGEGDVVVVTRRNNSDGIRHGGVGAGRGQCKRGSVDHATAVIGASRRVFSGQSGCEIGGGNDVVDKVIVGPGLCGHRYAIDDIDRQGAGIVALAIGRAIAVVHQFHDLAIAGGRGIRPAHGDVVVVPGNAEGRGSARPVLATRCDIGSRCSGTAASSTVITGREQGLEGTHAGTGTVIDRINDGGCGSDVLTTRCRATCRIDDHDTGTRAIIGSREQAAEGGITIDRISYGPGRGGG